MPEMFEGKDQFGFLQSMVSSWHASLKSPESFQHEILSKLLDGYRRTDYGRSHCTIEVDGVEDFRNAFPILTYKSLSPYLAEVKKGNYGAILPEPLACWVMTRGSTGPAKVLPATRTHLGQILTCGARALVNFAVRKGEFSLLKGKILNLNFPSAVHDINVDGKIRSYGYSSGTYAKEFPSLGEAGLLPKQEDIDALGSGIAMRDWERRFELVYRQALDENVIAAMGVAPVISSFAKYVVKKHEKKPKELWNFKALFCTSVPKIPFRYTPMLRKYFGQIPVVEIYSATEGVFGQQLDDLPYISPNYDTYFFEVKTGRGTKMLHELERGEWGELIVSTCMFPRYAIGDMIESAGNNYFRVFGRQGTWTILEHQLYNLLFGWAF